MEPLEPLSAAPTNASPIERLLLGAPAKEVAAELDRLVANAAGRTPSEVAATTYARGAFALREGSLRPAKDLLEAASTAFENAGDAEAAGLAAVEAAIATIRLGPRDRVIATAEELGALAARTPFAKVKCASLHVRGAALRLSGDATGTQAALLDALALSSAHPTERPKILNSLGTLYVVLGAYGAAEALLEHAVELQHRRGDVVGEAIACGQLGAAALGLGDLARARTWLQRQEWLTSQIGDAFGRSRALTFLADVALDLGRPDEALELAERALSVARSTTPPLAVWLAYAGRAAGRARSELGDPKAEATLTEARERFGQIGNQLGLALTEWDLLRRGLGTDLSWERPAWSLASMGLSPRVAALLRDRGAAEVAVQAVAQAAPHVTVPREVELVYEAPLVLAAIAERRTGGQRNLARLGALSVVSGGFVVGAFTWRGAGTFVGLPSDRAAAACAGGFPGGTLWLWPASAKPADIAADVAWLAAKLRSAEAKSLRGVLASAPEARVRCPPFAGEITSQVEHLDAGALFAAAATLQEGALSWPSDVGGGATAEVPGWTLA